MRRSRLPLRAGRRPPRFFSDAAQARARRLRGCSALSCCRPLEKVARGRSGAAIRWHRGTSRWDGPDLRTRGRAVLEAGVHGATARRGCRSGLSRRRPRPGGRLTQGVGAESEVEKRCTDRRCGEKAGAGARPSGTGDRSGYWSAASAPDSALSAPRPIAHASAPAGDRRSPAPRADPAPRRPPLTEPPLSNRWSSFHSHAALTV